jgi:hypothetical protein
MDMFMDIPPSNNNFSVLKIVELEKQIEQLKTENIRLNNEIIKESNRFTRYLNYVVKMPFAEQAELYR